MYDGESGARIDLEKLGDEIDAEPCVWLLVIVRVLVDNVQRAQQQEKRVD
jgi:hypothetical protein